MKPQKGKKIGSISESELKKLHGWKTKKQKVMKKFVDTVLQVETHMAELGVAFIEKKDGVWCAIDWNGGEMLFKLNFIK